MNIVKWNDAINDIFSYNISPSNIYDYFTKKRWVSSYPESKKSYWWDSIEDRYELELDLPGYDKDEISIKMKDDMLYVEANNEHRGKYEFSTNTPSDITNITSSLKNGVILIQGEKNKSEDTNYRSITIM